MRKNLLLAIMGTIATMLLAVHPEPLHAQDSASGCLRITEIGAMCRAKYSDKQIADTIRRRGTCFQPSEVIIDDLKHEGLGPISEALLRNRIENSKVRHIGDIKLELEACRRDSTTVTCDFNVSNNGKSNEYIRCHIFGKHANHVSWLFDDKSNRAKLRQIKFSGDNKDIFDLARDATVKLQLVFEGVSVDSQQAASMTVKIAIREQPRNAVSDLKLNWSSILFQ